MSGFPQKRASAQKPKSRRGTLLSAFQPHSETFTGLVLKSVFPAHTDLPAPTQQPPQTICSECQSWQASESNPLIFQTDALRCHHRAVGPQPPLTESHTTRRLPASLPVSPWNPLAGWPGQLRKRRAVVLRKTFFLLRSNRIASTSSPSRPSLLLSLLVFLLAGSSARVIRAGPPVIRPVRRLPRELSRCFQVTQLVMGTQ